jgi:hypothetical protein
LGGGLAKFRRIIESNLHAEDDREMDNFRARKVITFLAVSMGIFSFIFGGCEKRAKSKPTPAAPAAGGNESDFHDLEFTIDQVRTLADGRKSLNVSGLHAGRQVGFEVVVGPTWTGKPDPRIPIVVRKGVVTYRATGTNSDAYVQVLDELYGTKLNPKGMAPSTKFTGLSLEGDPSKLEEQEVKIKLFFESDKHEEYAEVYTNIHVAARKLEFAEKDPGYRVALVKALTAK